MQYWCHTYLQQKSLTSMMIPEAAKSLDPRFTPIISKTMQNSLVLLSKAAIDVDRFLYIRSIYMSFQRYLLLSVKMVFLDYIWAGTVVLIFLCVHKSVILSLNVNRIWKKCFILATSLPGNLKKWKFKGFAGKFKQFSISE